MPTDWTNPKIIVGNIASGTFYFPRPNIERSIWEEIEKGNHVLIAAPRRVGKSSVMQAMCDQHPEHTRCIFENIQGIKSESEYYQRFYELLLRCLNRFEKGKTWLNSLIKGISIEEIGPGGVKFGDKKEIQFDEAIKDLLLEISKLELQVVLLLDELPEVLNNLHRNKRTEEACKRLKRILSGPLKALRCNTMINYAITCWDKSSILFPISST